MNVVNTILASALGLGLSPVAPGTCGALLGVLIHVGTVLWLPKAYHLGVLCFAFLLVCVGNHLLTPWAEEYWQCKDPRHFVLDEVAGYLLVPILYQGGRLWQVALWGFILFRVLDIVKVPPARQIDRSMQGAWGILLDDLVSACYAVLCLHLLAWVSAWLGLGAWLVGLNNLDVAG